MFDSTRYGRQVAEILALDGSGNRLMPLAHGTCSVPEAYQVLRGVNARTLFDGSRAPEAALSGLYLYFSCLDEAHQIAQEINSAEGSFWHAIMHRQEPDSSNSAYWFRRVGKHPVFPALNDFASHLCEFPSGASWDPFRFIEFCETARRSPGSVVEKTALEIQRSEWQLLFDYCASPFEERS
jgi:hypothetical protein